MTRTPRRLLAAAVTTLALVAAAIVLPFAPAGARVTGFTASSTERVA
ncbi:hypothetical protein [Micromonospora zhanjiangensis]|uniref:Uncharacterized protein n=1 Tax=Micromonospora zhanjiangensis TaxID=1522057 RepID=A0ABV8KFS9_9ACTN